MNTENPAVTTVTTTESPIVQPGESVTVSSPIVENNPAPLSADPAAQPAAAAPNGEVEKGVQKRINELTGQKYEALRHAQTLEAKLAEEQAKTKELLAQIAKTPTPGATAEPAKPVISEEEIERRALEKAQLIAQAREFNKTCDTVAETGKKEFNDWDDSLKNLNRVGAIGKDVDPTFLQTVVELKNPHKILHHLGTHLEEAERLTKLPPAKMALEMARIEAQLNVPPPPAPVSNAPAPVIPVGGIAKGALDINDPNLPMEEFMALRTKQREEHRKRYQR